MYIKIKKINLKRTLLDVDVHEKLRMKNMKTEKYGKILYSGTPIILSFFFIFYYIETKKIDFFLLIGFFSTIVLTAGIYFLRYRQKFPLEGKRGFYYYSLSVIIWLYVILELSPFGLCRNFLFDTIIGFFAWMSIFAFFFTTLLFFHLGETWNELTEGNVWKRTGLIDFNFSQMRAKYKIFYISCIALCLIGLFIVFLKISLFGIVLVNTTLFVLVMSFYLLNKKR